MQIIDLCLCRDGKRELGAPNSKMYDMGIEMSPWE